MIQNKKMINFENFTNGVKKYFLLVSLLIFTILPFTTFAEVPSNSGFIPGQIWYSKDKLIEGETVNIHTAVWNSEKNSLSVKVEFYDKNVILGSRDVLLSASELKDVYIPWKVTSGDHTISAKIISSISTVSGKASKIVLIRNVTSTDKQFVSVVLKDDSGKTSSVSDSLKNKINETGENINDVVPEKVSDSVSNSFNVVEDFRSKTSDQINTARENTKNEIEVIKNDVKTPAEALDDVQNVQDAIKKPVTYLKLFFLNTLAFIFDNKIVFYGVSLLIVFYLGRFVYRKIRNR